LYTNTQLEFRSPPSIIDEVLPFNTIFTITRFEFSVQLTKDVLVKNNNITEEKEMLRIPNITVALAILIRCLNSYTVESFYTNF